MATMTSRMNKYELKMYPNGIETFRIRGIWLRLRDKQRDVSGCGEHKYV
jgi:hypothetical protein